MRTLPALLSLSLLTILSVLALTNPRLKSSAVASVTSETETIVVPVISDTYVSSGRPNERYGQRKTLWLGHDQSQGYGVEAVLLTFESFGLPQNATIQSANLILTLTARTPGDEAIGVSVQQILEAWPESINWSEHLALARGGVSAPVPLGIDLGEQYFPVTDLVRVWLQQGQPSIGPSFRLVSDRTSGQHERVFWAKECMPDCTWPAQPPRLEITYVLAPTPTPTPTPTSTFTPEPTPLPTNTPTATPTPTPTPTNTPGVLLQLSNSPTTWIAPQGVITYTISYQNNAVAEIRDLRIRAMVPEYTALMPDTDAASGLVQDDDTGTTVSWQIERLPPSGAGTVTYQVRRTEPRLIGPGTPTPPPPGTATLPWTDELSIVNPGVEAEWRWGEQAANGSSSSNITFNPLYRLYLTVIYR